MLKVATIGLLIWSIFYPFYASIAFICLFIILEGWFLNLDLTKRPNLQLIKEKFNLSDKELSIYYKYFVFYRFPTTSAKTSVTISLFKFSTFIWVPWLVYNQLWIPALLIGSNFFLARYLSRKLKPLHYAFHAKHTAEIFSEKEIIKSVYDKVVWSEGIDKKLVWEK